jgi:hypothetical protein
VQVAFVDLAPDRVRASEHAATVGGDSPFELELHSRAGAEPPAFSSQKACRAARAVLADGGPEVVDVCRPDDLACGTLFLTVEAVPSEGDRRLFVASIELSQPARLTRDPTRDLSLPKTWSLRRIGLVDPPALEVIACERLRDLAIVFKVLWQGANE